MADKTEEAMHVENIASLEGQLAFAKRKLAALRSGVDTHEIEVPGSDDESDGDFIIAARTR